MSHKTTAVPCHLVPRCPLPRILQLFHTKNVYKIEVSDDDVAPDVLRHEYYMTVTILRSVGQLSRPSADGIRWSVTSRLDQALIYGRGSGQRMPLICRWVIQPDGGRAQWRWFTDHWMPVRWTQTSNDDKRELGDRKLRSPARPANSQPISLHGQAARLSTSALQSFWFFVEQKSMQPYHQTRTYILLNLYGIWADW